MNARRVAAASGVIHAAQKTRQTAAGIAMALEAAGLLQSPESAAELVALRARVAELEKQAAVVAEFTAQRAEYITSILNCHPDNEHDYDRWQGHAAARRQLSERLGLPVAWPAEAAPSPVAAPVEDPCRPCGCPKRFDRHADGCPALAEDSHEESAEAEALAAVDRSIRAQFPLLAALRAMTPSPGELAEQRHLIDPLDHVLEHLADERAEPALEPYGCRGCGLPLPHGWQWTADQGLHLWMRPTDAQIKARMLARRSARLPAVSS